MCCPRAIEKPIRIEFFGNTVDEMRVFDPNTQRSTGQIDEVTLAARQPHSTGCPQQKADDWTLEAFVPAGNHKRVCRSFTVAGPGAGRFAPYAGLCI